MKLKKTFVISCVALGCGSDPGGAPSEGELAEVHQEIRNGWLDSTNTYPNVVSVEFYDQETFEFLNWCSGTLVAPSRVLTAASCFAGLTGSVVAVVLFDGDYREGISLRIHPLYSGATTHHVSQGWLSDIPVSDGPDVATLDLDEPIPMTPRPIATTPPPVGWIMKVVGYGEIATGVVPDERRVGIEIINFFLPLVKGSSFFSTPNGTMVLTSHSLGNIACQGDFGGPAINPAGEIVAVQSMLGSEDDNNRCNTGMVNSLSTTHDLRAWILLPPGTPVPYHNQAQPADVNNDGIVTSLDALIIINAINAGTGLTTGSFYRDAVADNVLTEADARYVIDYLENH